MHLTHHLRVTSIQSLGEKEIILIGKIVLIVMFLLIAACAYGPANYNDEPNSIQRADIVSKNKLGITIEHSTWGKKIAFRFADEHCNSLGKVAVYKGASKQYGPDVISTWECSSE